MSDSSKHTAPTTPDASPDAASPDAAQPDASPPGKDRGFTFLYDVFDSIIDELADDAHSGLVAAARKYYEGRRGKVFEDEKLWEGWTQAFLEWYAIERPGPADDAGVPATAFLTQEPDDDQRWQAVRAWLTSHRSLFEVRELNEGRVVLLDLIGGGVFSVVERRAMAGVSVGDVAEMRLIGYAGEVVFGRTFLFHPPGTRAAIVRHAQRMLRDGGTRADVIDHCASLRIRYERYRHVSPERIYEAQTGEHRISP